MQYWLVERESEKSSIVTRKVERREKVLGVVRARVFCTKTFRAGENQEAKEGAQMRDIDFN